MDEKLLLKGFGLRISQIRVKRGLSQEKLAELACLDRTYISSVERGHRNIALINICKLASALNVTPGDLLNNMEVPCE